MSCPTLEIDSIVVPLQSLLQFEQTYEDLAGETFRRAADGTGILRSRWSGKLRTEINGQGWVPSAFENIDTSVTHLMRMAVPRTVSSVSNVITIPSARRISLDYSPYGYALVGNQLVKTPVSDVTGDEVTLTPVGGAIGYRVNYWPEFTAAITVNDSRPNGDGEYRWRIVAEQI